MNTLTVIPAIVLSIAAFTNGQAVAANGHENARMCPVSASIPTDADRALADWKKKRALYLHDLRMSSLEQREDATPDKAYHLGSALIEADLYLSYAEADGLIDGNTKTGRNDLKMAVNELRHADAMVDKTGEKARIEAFKKTATALNKDFNGCMSEENPTERDQYQTLRKSLGKMIKQIG